MGDFADRIAPTEAANDRVTAIAQDVIRRLTIDELVEAIIHARPAFEWDDIIATLEYYADSPLVPDAAQPIPEALAREAEAEAKKIDGTE